MTGLSGGEPMTAHTPALAEPKFAGDPASGHPVARPASDPNALHRDGAR